MCRLGIEMEYGSTILESVKAYPYGGSSFNYQIVGAQDILANQIALFLKIGYEINFSSN